MYVVGVAFDKEEDAENFADVLEAVLQGILPAGTEITIASDEQIH